ncbi:MAG: IPExxxVDY family protein [Flavobacteriia bacterium]|nr:IPExxxVDY family protein [Flavobacteriia bacterium]
MSKQKKHILSLEQDNEYEMIGLCSHHNDYRLVWALNENLKLAFSKSHEDFFVVTKKGLVISNHSLYEFNDEENFLEYFLIKNKNLGKYLIPEKPIIDYFLFIYGIDSESLEELTQKLKKVTSVLAVFSLDPLALESTENLVFR